jgi:hypothetical protein
MPLGNPRREDDMDGVVQGLWVGDRLSTMEQLSVQSFLAHGHEYHLYAYDQIDGVPPGARLKDANEVLPRSMIFQYRQYATYAGFANYFRYKLLFDKGGWWVDTDVICLRPFVFDSDCVLATERDPTGREFVTSGIIKVPCASPVMERAWETCLSKNPCDLRWGETGPELMHRLACRLSLWSHAQAADTFCPIDPLRWSEALLPKRYVQFPAQTVAVHLWNEAWRRSGLEKDEAYAPGCLYEQLKRQYLGHQCQSRA